MATVTTIKTATTYTLELDEAEALYVLAALREVEPARDQFDGNDPAYEALSDALEGHVAFFGDHARPI